MLVHSGLDRTHWQKKTQEAWFTNARCLIVPSSQSCGFRGQTRFSCAKLKPLVSPGSMVRHQSEVVFISSNKIQLRLEVVRKWGLGEGKAWK